MRKCEITYICIFSLKWRNYLNIYYNGKDAKNSFELERTHPVKNQNKISIIISWEQKIMHLKCLNVKKHCQILEKVIYIELK